MNEQAKEARKKYYAAWRAKNRDKVRQYNARYWARRARQEALQAQNRQQEVKADGE